MVCTTTGMAVTVALGVHVDSGGICSDGIQMCAFVLGFCALFQHSNGPPCNVGSAAIAAQVSLQPVRDVL